MGGGRVYALTGLQTNTRGTDLLRDIYVLLFGKLYDSTLKAIEKLVYWKFKIKCQRLKGDRFASNVKFQSLLRIIEIKNIYFRQLQKLDSIQDVRPFSPALLN